MPATQMPDAIHPLPGGPLPGEPMPGGHIPSDTPPRRPDEQPDTGPTGPRTPYPVNDPGISEPTGPGSEPDYLPGGPTYPGTRFRALATTAGTTQRSAPLS